MLSWHGYIYSCKTILCDKVHPVTIATALCVFLPAARQWRSKRSNGQSSQSSLSPCKEERQDSRRMSSSCGEKHADEGCDHGDRNESYDDVFFDNYSQCPSHADGEAAIIVEDFRPFCAEEEVRVNRGQHVKQVFSDGRWSYVVTDDGMAGFVPSCYCRLLSSEDTSTPKKDRRIATSRPASPALSSIMPQSVKHTPSTGRMSATKDRAASMPSLVEISHQRRCSVGSVNRGFRETDDVTDMKNRRRSLPPTSEGQSLSWGQGSDGSFRHKQAQLGRPTIPGRKSLPPTRRDSVFSATLETTLEDSGCHGDTQRETHARSKETSSPSCERQRHNSNESGYFSPDSRTSAGSMADLGPGNTKTPPTDQGQRCSPDTNTTVFKRSCSQSNDVQPMQRRSIHGMPIGFRQPPPLSSGVHARQSVYDGLPRSSTRSSRRSLTWEPASSTHRSAPSIPSPTVAHHPSGEDPVYEPLQRILSAEVDERMSSQDKNQVRAARLLVMFDYKAQRHDEISLTTGDVIYAFVGKCHNGRVRAQLPRAKRTGFVPIAVTLPYEVLLDGSMITSL